MSDFADSGAFQDGGHRRRTWSKDEKRRIVAESRAPGASVAIVARRHGINANLLFTWRRQLGASSTETREAANIVPVVVASERLPADSPVSGASGRIEIVLAAGERVIVGADVEAAALATVIRVLSRR
jgi:transposase